MIRDHRHTAVDGLTRPAVVCIRESGGQSRPIGPTVASDRVVFLSRDLYAPGVISFESFDNANNVFDEREDGVAANPYRTLRLRIFQSRRG